MVLEGPSSTGERDPTDDDLSLDPSSSLTDAGSHTVPDVDATRSDMGAGGGDLDAVTAIANVVVSQTGAGDVLDIDAAIAQSADGDGIYVGGANVTSAIT